MVKLRHVRYPYTDGLIECAVLLIIHSSEIRTVVGWQQVIHSSEIRTVVGWQQVQALIIAGWCIPKSSPRLQEEAIASKR
jgi:hypothetical protein